MDSMHSGIACSSNMFGHGFNKQSLVLLFDWGILFMLIAFPTAYIFKVFFYGMIL